jgi:hypothetical protein
MKRAPVEILAKWTMSAALTISISARTAVAQIAAPSRPSLASLIVPVASSQLPNSGMAGPAPIGHRQPKVSDVPSENPGDIERRNEEDVRIDRKLIICRGC